MPIKPANLSAMKWIDDFLNRITMYRLVLYFLAILLGVSYVISLLGFLAIDHGLLVVDTAILLIVCVLTNYIFARVWDVTPNLESSYITALILALIITPGANLAFLVWAAVLAMASKYIITYHGKHIFNPAAIAVAITALAINQSASWWVGTATLMPIVLIGGLLIVRKIRRFNMALAFFIGALVSMLLLGSGLINLQRAILDTGILFFAFIMLTEPLTTPPTQNTQIIYGLLTGILFAPQIHIGSIYSTPELALLIGNLYAFMVSPKYKLKLTLKEKLPIGGGIYDFIFNLDKPIHYWPGQYLEWTTAVKNADSHGNRRYFTIASSPSEGNVRIGVKMYDNPSSFKKSLLELQSGDVIFAHQLAGDFVLPANMSQKFAFLAGGIGITPFRSMLKYLSDNQLKADITLLHSVKDETEAVYEDVIRESGIRVIRFISDPKKASREWPGKIGRINGQAIAELLPDYLERLFYISGPQSFVTSLESQLITLGIPRRQIKKDYFPGFV